MTSFADYLNFYNEQWKELMETHTTSQMPLQEYHNGSIWTTWMISFRAIQQTDEASANLLQLWACLDCKDLWYELLVPARRKIESSEGHVPEWFQAITQSKLTFVQKTKHLLSYSLIEGTQGGSYTVHPVVHEWAWQMQDPSAQGQNCWLAAVVVGSAVPEKTEKEYWALQRRLLTHADQYLIRSRGQLWGNIDEEVGLDTAGLDAVHMLGYLYADQGKLAEAEKMYLRALEGYEKTLGVGTKS